MQSALQAHKMLYRNFGNSGLKISVISVGNFMNYKPENYQEDKKIIQTAINHGINYFDTSERYAEGLAEIQLGNIIKQLNIPRQEIVISTKIHTAKDADMNSQMTTNRKHAKQSIKKSLKRLQMEYVDVLYANGYDSSTPLEEICRSFHEIIEDGQALYWATSNWDEDLVYQALGVYQRLNLHKPIATQSQYNMMVRSDMEVEYKSLFSKYNYGLIGWSPLAGGFLTGKYLNGIPQNEVNRFTDKIFFGAELLKGLYYDAYSSQKIVTKLRSLSDLAQSLGYKLNHLALAWAIKYQYLSSALVGARTADQLEDTVRAIDLLHEYTSQLEVKINKILDNTPKTRMDFVNQTLSSPVRPVQ